MAKSTDASTKTPGTAVENVDDVVRIWLGNRAAIEVVEDTEAAAKLTKKEIEQGGVPTQRRPIPVKKAATFVRLVPGTKLFDGIRDVLALWPNVSDAPAPAWVASTDPRYAELLAEHFAGEGHTVEVREPENPDEAHGPYVTSDGK